MWEHTRARISAYRQGQASYAPKARLACGGMAEVWRGEACFPDGHIEHVAFKRLLPDLADSPLYRRMLEDEARIGMLLRHPNIVRVFDARMLNGSYVLVMELVEGASLREILRDLTASGGSVSLSAALHIAREIARALEFAHEAIDDLGRELCVVHRDVSPHNVLVSEGGNIKLVDFGLAQSSANLAEHDSRTLGGKLGYLAPELILRQEVSPSLDLFALGVVLWECLAGQRLFQGKDEQDTVRRVVRCQVPPLANLLPGLPSEIDQLLSVLLTRDPAQRHGSARDLGAELEYLSLRYGTGQGAVEAARLVYTLRERRSQPSMELEARNVSRSGAQPVGARFRPLARDIRETRDVREPRRR